jgi:1,4-alpha-glucan branching enzyme
LELVANLNETGYVGSTILNGMYARNPYSLNNNPDRFSAKRMAKPMNFICFAQNAQAVSVVGDFNQWNSKANPMARQPDGAWFASIPLHHGHHRYLFLVDGKPMLDPKAQGIARNDQNERVSLLAVS